MEEAGWLGLLHFFMGYLFMEHLYSCSDKRAAARS
jgi:hypothetical protein